MILIIYFSVISNLHVPLLCLPFGFHYEGVGINVGRWMDGGGPTGGGAARAGVGGVSRGRGAGEGGVVWLLEEGWRGAYWV